MTFADNPVIAHRGAWKAKSFPQNSIASLKQAIALGCSGSEFDVWMTADDCLVVNHDPDYNGILIEKSTYADLEQFKLFNGEKLPTLEAYLLAGLKDNSHTQLVCELKPSESGKFRTEQIVRQVLKIVDRLNANEYLSYISFDYHMLQTIQKLNPNARTQYLSGDKRPEILKADNITGINYYFEAYNKNPAWIEEAKRLKLTLSVWTVNDEQKMNSYIANGFNYITTNEPELLFELLLKK